MDPSEVLEIIQTARDKGKRPNFYGTDFDENSLTDVDFHKADLSWTNLAWVDLDGADLRGTDLSGARLYGADLRETIGCHILTHTQHGYTIVAIWHDTGWRIQGGCRDFSITLARAHWGSDDYPYRPDGERICLMLDWLERQPTPEQKED